MKWYAQLLLAGMAVILPATAFSFPGREKKSKDAVPPPLEMPAPMQAPAAPAAPKGPTHAGKVLETMNGGGYTYILLEEKGEKHWFAVPEAPVTVGQELELMQGMEMGKFTSRALGRTFDSINFSGGIVGKESDEAIKKKAHAGVMAERDKGAEAPVKVEKATGANAYTIEQIFGKRDELAGKQVLLRAKVTKVSEGIMGRNWVHLRDGSGDAKGNQTLIVTSKEVPKVGDVVTVSGELTKDKDFGSGYKYELIIENAAIKP